MPTTFDLSWVQHFQAVVHLQFQQMGSKIENTVQTKKILPTLQQPFRKVGKVKDSTKAQHGKVPIMNVDHTPVVCQLEN